MAQPDGVPRTPRDAEPFAVGGAPGNRIPAPPPLPAPPAVSPTARPHTGFQRIYHWRDPVAWLLPVASAVLSFFAAAVLFHSTGIALALLALIFVHEMGHVVALKLMRIPVSAPIFVPLVGAFVVPGQIRRARDVAIVALAGPFSGGLCALACLVVSQQIGARDCLTPVFSGAHISDPCFSYIAGPGYSWLRLAYAGFLFNLFNLLPLFPLDGGRVAATISRWLWLLGILISVALLLVNPQPLTWILVLVAVALTVWAFRQREPLAPVSASTRARVSILIAYAGLALLLAVGMLLTQDDIQFIQAASFPFFRLHP